MIELPSCSKLVITVSPFSVSRALYQAVVEEAKNLKLDAGVELDTNFAKDIICTMLASKKVEACIEECFKRCTYNGLKINADTFEPLEARDDYLTVCFEVAKANISPFTKSLFAKFSPILEKLKGVHA